LEGKRKKNKESTRPKTIKEKVIPAIDEAGFFATRSQISSRGKEERERLGLWSKKRIEERENRKEKDSCGLDLVNCLMGTSSSKTLV